MMNLSAVFGKFSPIFRDLFKMSLEDIIHVA